MNRYGEPPLLGRRTILKAGLVLGAGAMAGPALSSAIWPADAAAADTHLLVRANLIDSGGRPVYPFWESPDIVASSGDVWSRILPGGPLHVSVVVRNTGTDMATGVQATFFWSDPSTAITPDTVNLIGTSGTTSIAGGGSTTLFSTTDWTPLTGTECLVVSVESDQESPASFLPEFDSRVAQRNVQASEVETNWHLPLHVGNPFPDEANLVPEPAHVELRVDSYLVRNAMRLIGHELPIRPVDVLVHIAEEPAKAIAGQLGLVVQRTDPGVGITLLDLSPSEQRATGLSEDDLRRLRDGAPGPADWGRVVAKLDMAGFETAVARLGFSHPVPRDAAIVHDFREVIGGVGIGGYAMVVPPTA
jgi:hypothetical protein